MEKKMYISVPNIMEPTVKKKGIPVPFSFSVAYDEGQYTGMKGKPTALTPRRKKKRIQQLCMPKNLRSTSLDVAIAIQQSNNSASSVKTGGVPEA